MAFIEAVIFIIGLVFLIKGSDYFVKSTAAIAEKFNIPEFIIGLTLVALGTSIPELSTSIIAALNNESGIIIGNIIGSNIANIGLIIGVAASIQALKTEEKMLIRDGYIMLFVTLLFYVFIMTGKVSRVYGGFLIALYIAYIFFVIETQAKTKDEYHFKAFITYFFEFQYILTLHHKLMSEIKYKRNKEPEKAIALVKEGILKDFFVAFISAGCIFFGAKYLLIEAIYFANLFNISKTVIGVSLIAFGTSVPELSVSIVAARKGYGNIAIGNIIGSNIANILLVGGVATIINPIKVESITIFFSGPFMILFSVFLLFFIKSNWHIRRIEGMAFLAAYLIFMFVIFFNM